MKKSSLLSLLAVLLLPAVVSLPRTAAARAYFTAIATGTAAGTTSSHVECVGVYTANSTYEANRRRLAGLLLAEARHRPYYTERAVGYWPNRLEGSFFCRRRDVDGSGDSSCAACIAGALLEMDRECPYHREASFSSRNCTLELGEYRILGIGGIHGEFCCRPSFNLQKPYRFFNL